MLTVNLCQICDEESVLAVSLTGVEIDLSECRLEVLHDRTREDWRKEFGSVTRRRLRGRGSWSVRRSRTRLSVRAEALALGLAGGDGELGGGRRREGELVSEGGAG